ncbi:MAG: hypothetical protein WCX93_00705 [Burkholderiaceae bacterium]
MKAAKTEFPFKWPFPPRPKAQRPRRGKGVGGSAAPFTRKAMLADVVLVIFWGASIPGLMWLGAAGGF